jgi:hypothetical protein
MGIPHFTLVVRYSAVVTCSKQDSAYLEGCGYIHASISDLKIFRAENSSPDL